MTALTQGEIYAAYREKVLSYLSGKMESPEDAEDLCEEVFEQVSRSLPRFRPFPHGSTELPDTL